MNYNRRKTAVAFLCKTPLGALAGSLMGVLLALSLLIAVGFTARAMETSVDTTQKVYDYAGLLTEEEKNALAEQANALSVDEGVDVVIVTTDDNEGLRSMEYADDFYDYNGFSADGILMLINMDDREVWISTSGSCILVFSDRRIEIMIENVTDTLSKGRYASAGKTFLNDAAEYLRIGASSDNYTHDVENPEDIYYGEPAKSGLEKTVARIPFYLFASAAVAAIVLVIMIQANKSAKRAREAARYLENDSIMLSVKNDQFLHSTVTKTKIQSESSGGSGGGGSSTHTSSSGSSHGGGGGRF